MRGRPNAKVSGKPEGCPLVCHRGCATEHLKPVSNQTFHKGSTGEWSEIGPVVSASQKNARGPPNAKLSGKPYGGPGGTRLAASTRTSAPHPAQNALPARILEGPEGKSREPRPGVGLGPLERPVRRARSPARLWERFLRTSYVRNAQLWHVNYPGRMNEGFRVETSLRKPYQAAAHPSPRFLARGVLCKCSLT